LKKSTLVDVALYWAVSVQVVDESQKYSYKQAIHGLIVVSGAHAFLDAFE
jgi:hypothetical protein